MSTPINTGNFPKLLWPGLNAIYGDEYKQWDPQWEPLFDKYTSKRNYEEDVGVSMFGLAAVKPEGNPIQYDSARQGFTTRYTHITYALGFTITREMMEDDLYGTIGKKRAAALARSMRHTKEVIAANVYNRAFTSGYTGGDGATLCSASHPNVAGGTQSNQLATAANLSEAALEQMCIDIMGLTDDRGLKIALQPQMLIIPKDLVFEAERILKSDLRVATANNDINALKLMGKFPKGVKVNQYLTSSTAYWIKTSAGEGMKYFERRGDQFEMDNDFDTENAKFKATARYSFGWTDWRQIYGTPGV